MSDAIRGSSELSFSPQRVIEAAARTTGADFDFLLSTAARESNFDAGAEARTSSAAGLFQFIEQTWMAMMSRHGDKHGFGDQASAITRDASGRFDVSDPAKREEILNLRFDPRAASLMAGELAAENAGMLRAAIGREPSTGELYAAHFLGARGAAELIQSVDADPTQRADQLLPEAAAANRPVFYRDGQALTAGDLLAGLTGVRAVTPPERFANAPSDPTTGSVEGTAPSRRGGVSGYTAFRVGDGILSPALVELLASLEAPDPARRKG